MQVYRPPIHDIRFILENFGYEDVQALDCFKDFDLETVVALAEASGDFCANEMLPLNKSGDEEGVSSPLLHLRICSGAASHWRRSHRSLPRGQPPFQGQSL